MSASDSLLVWAAGNLRDDVQLVVREGVLVATAVVCVSATELRGTTLVGMTVQLPLEVSGSSAAHAFARLNGCGSRVVLQGSLRPRPAPTGTQLVLVVERILADGAMVSAPISGG